MIQEIEPNSAINSSTAISLSVVVSGALSSNSDKDFFKFTTPQAGVVSLKFDVPTDTTVGYFRIGLYNASGVLLNQFVTGADHTYQMAVSEGGPYYVAVDVDNQWLYDSNFYSLTVDQTADPILGFESESNDSVERADVIVLGGLIRGQLSSNEDLDVYKFTAPQAGVVSLKFDAPTNSPVEYFLVSLYDIDGFILDRFYTGLTETYVVGVQTGGEYYVTVEVANPFLIDTGFYSLAVNQVFISSAGFEYEINDYPELSDTLAFGSAIVGQLSSADDLDFYHFIAPSFGLVDLKFDVPTNTTVEHFRLSVYDTDGLLLN